MSDANERQFRQVKESSRRIGESIAVHEERLDQHESQLVQLWAKLDKLDGIVNTVRRTIAWAFGFGAALGAFATILINGLKASLKP